VQDSNLVNGQQIEIPYYFLEAFAYGLALRLAMMWAPDKVQLLKPLADESYDLAARQNIETAQQYISPMISSYFRA
jgi:membrane-bound lytic murein transglycosylase MltF